MNYVSGVYIILSNIKPHRCYIGSARNVEVRWRIHKSDLHKNGHHAIKLQRHYNKYGLGDLALIVIEECDVDNLIEREQFYIDLLHPYFNSSPHAGSCLGFRHSDEAKKKMRESRPPVSNETRKKQSMAKRGKPSPQKGRHYSDEKRLEIYFKRFGRGMSVKLPASSIETAEKISRALTGKKLSLEHRRKIGSSNRGKKFIHTPEWNAKIGMANRGKIRSAEIRKKLSEAHKHK